MTVCNLRRFIGTQEKYAIFWQRGGNQEIKHFAAACRSRGLAVVMFTNGQNVVITPTSPNPFHILIYPGYLDQLGVPTALRIRDRQVGFSNRRFWQTRFLVDYLILPPFS